jgi:hypothetical protein
MLPMRTAMLIEIAVVTLSAPWAPARAVPLDPAPLSEEPRVICVTYWAEAKYVGFAYNHIVHVTNACNVPASCTVTTNVNPQPQTVDVPAGSQMDVLTFVGSPARTFVADVQCVRQAPARVEKLDQGEAFGARRPTFWGTSAR